MAARKKSNPLSCTALVVLGMHRSGTSALAGVLGHMGADLPQELMPPNEANPHGYFESMKAYWLNDALLASAGSSWDDWKAINPDWYQSPRRLEYHDRATEMLGLEFGRSGFFVLKDPRVCRLVPFWKDVLHDNGIRPLFVCTHRHPQEVVASLARREGWSASQGLLLWLRHVLDAEVDSRGAQRVFVSYDMLLADWRQTLDRISKRLSLHWPVTPDSMAPAITGFLSDALRHFRASGDEAQQYPLLDGWVGEVHAVLERWAASGESKADHARLVAIRAAMQEAEPMFDPLLRENQQQRQQVETQRRRIKELEAALHAKHLEVISQQTNHASEQKLRGEAEIRSGDLIQTLEQMRAEVAGHQANHAIEQKQRKAVELQRAELVTALENAQAVATEQAAALARAQSLVVDHVGALASAEAESARLAQAQARLEDDLHVSQAATMTAVQEADHLRSALIQRRQETEDLHRQTLADAGHITGLQTTLADLTREHATLTRQAARDGRHLAAMTARLTAVMQRDLERRLTGQTEQAAAQAVATEQAIALARAESLVVDHIGALASAEAESARLAQAQARLEDDLHVSQAATMTAVQEAAQLRSALIQREQETEDLHRRTFADAAHITQLQTTLADLTQSIDQMRAEAVSHQATEQKQREAVELQRAELVLVLESAQAVVTEQAATLAQAEFLVLDHISALASAEAESARLAQAQARLEDDLHVSQAATMTAVQEADQLRNALIQRGQQTEDLHRQTLADAGHITGLQNTLADLTREHATLTRQATAANVAQQAEVLQQRQLADERIAALQSHVQALHNSTSWKLTSPLRLISASLRRPKA